MPPKRRHHFVPQFYLRGFTDPSTPVGHTPYVWVWDLAAARLTRRAPRNVAAAGGYYAPSAGADTTRIENALAAMEGRAAVALRHYLATTPGTRPPLLPQAVSAFVAWQAARVPWQRRAADTEWARLLRDAAAGRDALPDDPGFQVLLMHDRTGVERRESLPVALALLRAGAWTPRFDQDQQLEVMRLQAWYYDTRHFPRLHWVLLTAPAGHAFVTSDRPVMWLVPGVGESADLPAALKSPAVELTMPLDRRHALLALGAPPDPGLRVTVDEVNRRTAAGAEHFVIAPAATLLSDGPLSRS